MELKVLYSTHVPGIGSFKAGDIVKDKKLVEKLKANAEFQEVKNKKREAK